MNANRIPQINISSIPVGDGAGAGLAILVLLTALLVDLPGVRWLALWGTLTGVALGGSLIAWRRHAG
jgi:hypothetical protein